MVVGRFAPSPSGRMHLGNVFSALLAWLSARSAGGELLLRIEDLDPDRCRPEYAAQLRDDLRWLGLSWDREGPAQSTRGTAYAEAFRQLEARGLVYPCYCTRAELHAASAPHASDGTPVYPGTCRGLTAAERAAKTRAPAWRLRVPEERIGFRDGLQGLYEEALARDCGDFIVLGDSYAYTGVVRGRDLLSSTPRQLWLQQLLGFPEPEYYHVPLLRSADGRRLSKRDRDLDLGVLRAQARPERLLGVLAAAAGLLPQAEDICAAELVPLFSWEKIHREDMIFSESALQNP